MRQILVLGALVVAATAVAPQAQERGRFSGRWVMVGEATAAHGLAGALVGICGIECEVLASDTTVTIKRERAYKLAMPEVLTVGWTQSRDLSGGRGAAPSPRVTWTSEWTGDVLVITTVETSVGARGDAKSEVTSETRHSLSLEGDGLKIATKSDGRPPAQALSVTVTSRKASGSSD